LIPFLDDDTLLRGSVRLENGDNQVLRNVSESAHQNMKLLRMGGNEMENKLEQDDDNDDEWKQDTL
jgi:hypothetical protein